MRTQQCPFCGRTHLCVTPPFAWDGIHCPYNPEDRKIMDRNHRPKRVKCGKCKGAGKIRWLMGVAHQCPECKGRGFKIAEE